MTLGTLIFLVLLLILIEGFFTCSETAFLSASRAKIIKKAKEGVKEAKLASSMLLHPERLFSTTVLGTTLAMNTTTTLVTLYIIHHFGFDKEWYNLIVLSPIILIFAEFLPKMTARRLPEVMVFKFVKPLRIASILLFPLAKILMLYAGSLQRLFGSTPRGFFLSREEVKGAVNASKGTDVTATERFLIERIFEFGNLTIGEMFRPLIEVVAIEDTSTVGEALKVFSDSGHSRLVVYRERVDNIVGVLQGIDCIRVADPTQVVSKLMKPPLFVPLSKPIDELLHDLRVHPMAIAVNEYGGAEGIATMEDVIEEVVGEIEDEYDESHPLFHKIGENSYIVNARMEIDALRRLGIPVPDDEEYQTLAGFLLKRMQKIPKKWDSTIIDGVEYVIQSATDRSIEEVYVILHHTN